MRTAVATLVLAALALVPSIIAQQQDSSRTSTALQLTGCVSPPGEKNNPYTLTDSTNGETFRLTGKKMDKYAGKKVVVDGPSKRVAVRAGLWPSPNIAGQAGDLDPAQESIARQRGGGGTARAGSVLPEFHVVRVRTVEGTCP